MQFSDRMGLFEDEIFLSLNIKKNAMEAQGKKVYNLSIGTPDFHPSEYIRKALSEAAMDPENWKYALRDIPELLNAVCDYYRERFGVEITEDMVCSCYGSQEGIGHIGLVLCNKGDCVLLPTPCYPVFMTGVKMAEAEPYFYPMSRENDFLPDFSSIPEDIARKAKYMILSLPSNPMGSVGTPAVYEEAIAFAKKYDILLIHDNAYSDIIFDDIQGGSFLAYPGAKEIGVEFFSLSKSFNVTGARLSFLIGNPEVVGAYRKFKSQIDFGVFLPVQKAATAILRGPRDGVKKQCQEYQARRDALCGGLRKIGWNIPDSHGSMFVWAPLPEGYSDSMAFCMELLEKAGVLCTPGASFGPLGEGYVRFALVLPPEQLELVAEAIKDSGLILKKH